MVPIPIAAARAEVESQQVGDKQHTKLVCVGASNDTFVSILVNLKIPDSLTIRMKGWWESTPDEGILRFESGRRGSIFGLALLALAAYLLSGSLMEIIQCPYSSCTRQEMVVWNIPPLLGSSILLYSSAYLLSTHALEIDPSLRVIRTRSELLGLRWRVYSHGFDEVIRVQRTADEDTGDSGVIVVKGNKISNKYVAEWILGDEQEIADAIGVPFVDRT